MPAYQLTAAWQQVASAGQSVTVQNQSAAPATIATSTGVPTASDGIVLGDAGAGTTLHLPALTSDLFARCDGDRPVTLEVLAF